MAYVVLQDIWKNYPYKQDPHIVYDKMALWFNLSGFKEEGLRRQSYWLDGFAFSFGLLIIFILTDSLKENLEFLWIYH